MTQKKLMRLAAANTATAADFQAEMARISRIMFMVFAAVLVFAMLIAPAFAAGDAGDAIQQGVKTGLKQIYGIITAVVVPIAVIAVAFSAFKIFTGGEKGMQTAKMTILYTVVGVIIVYLAPVAIQQISTWITPDTTVFD